MFSILKRRKRVACTECDASHPATYEGQSCLICGSPVDAASAHRKDAGPKASGKPKTKKERPTEIVPPHKERDWLSATSPALPRQRGLSAPEYEWQVKLAAKGLAERDSRLMPKSITPEAFYEIMAAAALDATDLRALLERATRAERELETIQDALRRADTEAKDARHQRRPDEVER